MSSGNVGKLNILVGAHVGGLKKDLAHGSGIVTNFAHTVQHNIGHLATAFGIGLGIHAFQHFISHSMETIRTTGIMSKKLSISTEEFTKLGFAAVKSGTSQEALAGGLAKMERSIGNAAEKGGQAAKVFSGIGLDVKELATLAPDQAFLKISNAIKSIEDPFKKAAAITAIFGRGGMELSILLNKGSDEIHHLGEEAKHLGITFTDLDVSKIREARAGWVEMKEIVHGVGQQFAISLAPSLKFVNETLAHGLVGARNFFGTLRNEVAFFVGTWSLQWQLIKINTAIVWDTLKASGVATFDAIAAGLPVLGRNFLVAFENFPKIAVASWEAIKAGLVAFADNFKGVFTDLLAVVKAWAASNVAAIKAVFNLEDPIAAATNAFKTTFAANASGAFAEIGTQSSKAFSDSLAASGGLKAMESVGDAMGTAFQQGLAANIDPALDAQKKKIVGQIADTRKEFDAMQAGTAKGAEHGADGKTPDAQVKSATSKFAAATQVGTSEAASQIFAAISAKSGKDDEVKKNTAKTAENTDRIASALENMEMPDFEVVEAF